MSKQYRIHVREFKIDPDELDLSELSDVSVTKEKKSVLFAFTKEITDKDNQELYKFQELLELTEKEEYNNLSTDAERINFLAKRLGFA